jgi:hypothetical protein
VYGVLRCVCALCAALRMMRYACVVCVSVACMLLRGAFVVDCVVMLYVAENIFMGDSSWVEQ